MIEKFKYTNDVKKSLGTLFSDKKIIFASSSTLGNLMTNDYLKTLAEQKHNNNVPVNDKIDNTQPTNKNNINLKVILELKQATQNFDSIDYQLVQEIVNKLDFFKMNAYDIYILMSLRKIFQ